MLKLLIASAIALTIVGMNTVIALQTPTDESQVFFTRKHNCTAFIVRAIEKARYELRVQAYLLTSCPIIKAIARAKGRNVDVNIILDRANEQERYEHKIAYLQDRGINLLVDDTVEIAHDKVIIIDRNNVITGSFNFTRSAQARNAENVVIISEDIKVKSYTENWKERAAVSRPILPSIAEFSDQWTCR